MVRFIISLAREIRIDIINLHSNMVRFIIHRYNRRYTQKLQIYIPIWLDLLYLYRQLVYTNLKYLHSNMVRFIILMFDNYIALDMHLHSNMVRFIMI